MYLHPTFAGVRDDPYAKFRLALTGPSLIWKEDTHLAFYIKIFEKHPIIRVAQLVFKKARSSISGYHYQ